VNTQAVIYLALVANQLLAVVAFLALYGRDGDWRDSAVGRHVMYWVLTAGALDLSWVLLLVARWAWLVWMLFVAQGLVGLVTWQRVWLVWQARRRA
jgi:hypothetical protein